MKFSREWATPMVIGVFAVMAVTGLLMFFHVNSAVQEAVHEWAGWLLVAAVLTHVGANWLGFKRYLQARGKGAALIPACAIVLAATFFFRPGGQAQQPPPAIAMRAMSQAPVGTVAALFGKSGEQARRELGAVGITLASDAATIGSAIGDDREKMGRALVALAGTSTP